MLKTRKRWVALLTAVVMVAALLVPFAGTASASCTYSLSWVPAITAGGTVAQSPANYYVTVTLDNTTAQNLAGSSMVLQLPSSPSGFGIDVAGLPATTTTTGGGLVTAPASTTTIGADGAEAGYNVTLTPGAPGSVAGTAVSWEVYVNGYAPTTFSGGTYNMDAADTTFNIPITAIYAPGGVNGNVTMTGSVPNGSLFTPISGVTIATAGTGTVTLAAESVQSISSGSGQPIGVIDITESMPGAISNSGGTAMKFTLPPGVTWDSALYTTVWGTPGALGTTTMPWQTTFIANGGRELDISAPTGYLSIAAMYVKLTGTVSIDQSVAKQGDIVITVSGSATYSPSTLTVADYGTYAVSDKVLSTPTITAGMAGSTIGEFEILEGLPGSLLPLRTIDLTLPDNVAWSQVPSEDTSNSTMDSLNIASIDAVGSSGNEIEITLGGQASTTGENPAVIALKNAEVTPAVDFTGALSVTVGGTEGLTGTINLGTVAAGVTAAASTTPDVTIGTASANIGTLTITEAAAGNIQSIAEYSSLDASGNSTYNSSGATNPDYFVATNSSAGTAEIDVWAPSGVTFFNTPTVTVTAGDLQLGTISTNTIDNQGELVIPIKSTSTTASTISITGTQITVDRTVPEGPITFKAKGTGVDETELTNANGTVEVTSGTSEQALFPNDTTAAQANVANVTTAAEGGGAGTSVFKIGATSYTLNGNSVNIDVAPYIMDSRTFLPLRYVANALGVADSNIMFDPTTQKVTIIKGSMVVQLTIGSTTMLLNGAAITMDTAPEITSGRTCLPVAWVAQALNANVVWDATAQTVTITSN